MGFWQTANNSIAVTCFIRGVKTGGETDEKQALCFNICNESSLVDFNHEYRLSALMRVGLLSIKPLVSQSQCLVWKNKAEH